MKRLRPIIAAVFLVGSALAQEEAPTVRQLLDDVILHLPREPLDISGDIIVRKRRGIVLKELKFQMMLNWGGQPPIATYVIRDTFGRSLEQLTISRPEGKEPVFQYQAGDPLKEITPPDLSQCIQETDISWMDLTLSFLWWKDGKTVGKENVKGRSCLVVEVSPPVAKACQYAKVRLWIDEQIRMLLQADGLDANGKCVRSLWIKSFKKINDRWMIKDLEIQAGSLHRTKLTVHEVNGEKTGLSEPAGESQTDSVLPVPVRQEG